VSSAPSKIVLEEVRVPMRDGARLAADLVRVDDGERRPVLLLRSPYLRPGIRQNVDIAGLARSGWVVVGQDTRGRGDSEGSAEPFVSEAADGRDTIAWCAKQPWSDGRVAMAGGSYLSFAQLQAAATAPPALRAISPFAAPDALTDQWHYVGGAFCTGLVTNWNVMMAMMDPTVGARARRRIMEISGDPRALMAIPHAKQPLRGLYPPFERAFHPEDRAYWRRFDLTQRYRRMDVAGHHVAGWYDIFCESNLRAYRSLRSEAPSAYARASQRLIVGPWVHGAMLFRMTAEMDFGHAANGIFDGTMARMYEWLRDAVDGKPVESGVKAFVLGRNDWVELDDWPPAARTRHLYLSSAAGARSARGDGQQLARHGPTGTDRMKHDPHEQVPKRGGRILGPWLPTAGPIDQRPVEQREDVLVFSTPPLEAPLTIMGSVTADVVFRTTGRSADVCVKLVDVWPDGRAFNVLDSVTRASFTPGRAKEVRVELGSIAQEFGKGHAIRVEIASSNFPRFDVNPSTGVPLAEVDRYEQAVQTVSHGARTGTRITLPVVSL
jgi:putative CocE/NonD family hydrolase